MKQIKCYINKLFSVCLINFYRDEPTVFSIHREEIVITKQDENIRESIQNMVSTIDDVSFGENNKFPVKNNDVVNCSPIKDGSSSPKPAPMEVDQSPPPPLVVNGFGSGSSGNSKNGPENTISPTMTITATTTTTSTTVDAVNSIQVKHIVATPELISSTNCDSNNNISSSKPVVNGVSSSVNNEISSNKPVPSLITSSSQPQQQDGDTTKLKSQSDITNPPVNIIQIKRKRPAEELKTPFQPNINIKKKFTPQSLRTFPTKNDDNPVPPEPSSTSGVTASTIPTPNTTVNTTRTPTTPKGGPSSKSSRLPPLKIDTTFAIQVGK